MTAQLPDGLDTLLTRTRTAAALTESGYVTSPATLATKVSRGGGPPYRMFGPRALYRWGDALAWAEGRMSQPRRSSSEADAQQANAA